MGPEITPSPSDPSTGRHWQPVSPRSPYQSSDAVSNLHSPWLDPLSPNLRDSPVFTSRHDSQMGLMGFNRAEPSPTLGVFHSSTNKLLRSEPWWKKALKSKWSMIIGLVLGVGGALGHHFLYHYLDGREATDQQWWLRLGQFISFVAKANFVITVMMAHQQVAWRVVGQKGCSVKAIDSLFGSAHNFMEIFNREAWIRSRLVMFLAMYMWASPFVVIFTSATLDVVPGTLRDLNATCPSVRTLNFSHESKDSWRTPWIMENNTLNGLSLSQYNETYRGGNLYEGKNSTALDIFEYWDQPSNYLGAISSGVISRNRATQRENVSADICGKGWDCSTTIHFVAPGYYCTEHKEADPSDPVQLDDIVPTGNLSYKAITQDGEYARPQIATYNGSAIVPQPPPFPTNLGAFRTEPMIWIGYAAVEDTTQKHERNRSQKSWNTNYTAVIFSCEHRETNYTVDFNYTGGIQTYNVTKRDYKQKIINTKFAGNFSDDGTFDRTYATPDSKYVTPKSDYGWYRQVAAYHSLGKKLRDLLAGEITWPEAIAEGLITTSKLIDRHESLPVPNLQHQVRRLYEDLIISLLSDPQFAVVAWAADPTRRSGTGRGGEDTRYKCVRQKTGAFFFYHWPVLVSVYFASFAIAAMAVAYGIFAMQKDGIDKQREMTFSSIAGATRVVNLEQVDGGATKIRCWPVEESPGDRYYEFRAERHGGQ
ncbi:hypothetical protein AUP68_02482 [Ilyonectria robusta]